MKKQFIEDMKVGDQIEDVFVLVDYQIKKKKNGDLFANLNFADKTGQIRAVIWNDVSRLTNKLSVGKFVKVRAIVGEYQKRLQLVLQNIELMFDRKTVELSDFLPVTSGNIDQMFDRLKQVIATIKTPCLKKLFNLFLEDDCFIEKFKFAPAAKRLHHAYVGGLLEHVLSMLLIGEQLASHYEGIDRDLLLSGIVFHDIGKIRELECGWNIDYTDEGRFLSHIVIGVTILDEKIKQISDFPREIEYLLKHLIVSHHGSKSFGSPEPPKTVEAILLNCIDDMDFRMNSVCGYINSDKNDSSWTLYNSLMERHFYRGVRKDDKFE